MNSHIRPRLYTLLAGLLLSLVMTLPARAAESVPPLINYQGALTDANGAPMAGVKTMEFNLYDAPTGGNLIWGPQVYATVPLIGGKFNVLLGPTDSGGKLITTAFTDKTRYLSITIEGKEILPRQQILSSPFAMQAMNGSPPGAITAYMSNTIPDGWLLCNGAAIPQEPKYDKLRSLIGNNVPDMRGMFLRGAGQNADGNYRYDGDQNRGVGSYQWMDIQSHTHDFDDYTYSEVSGGNWGMLGSSYPWDFDNAPTSPWRHGSYPTGGPETRPKNIAVNWIIKY